MHEVKLVKDLKPLAKQFNLKLVWNKDKNMHVLAISSNLIERGLVLVTTNLNNTSREDNVQIYASPTVELAFFFPACLFNNIKAPTMNKVCGNINGFSLQLLRVHVEDWLYYRFYRVKFKSMWLLTIYMRLMVVKSLYTIFGGLHKKGWQWEVENFQGQERKLWKLLKSFPNKKM